MALTGFGGFGVLNECTQDDELRYGVEHCPPDVMKGDAFTKALNAIKFKAAIDMLRLVSS